MSIPKSPLQKIESRLDNIYKNNENGLISAVCIKNKTYVLRFSNNTLSWHKIGTETCRQSFVNLDISEVNTRSKGEYVNSEDIISIKLNNVGTCYLESQSKDTSSNAYSSCIKNESVTILYVSKHNKNRWSLSSLIVEMSHERHAKELKVAMDNSLKAVDRPKSLLIFINPISGSGRANKVYNKYVKDLLHECDVNTTILCTEYANHSKQLLMNHEFDISCYDGIACIGGDGSFVELVHGIMGRVNKVPPSEQGGLVRPCVRLGIIPTGSTDAICYSINGTDDIVTACLHIIMGGRQSLDLGVVHKSNGDFIRYNVSMFAYGFYGDAIKYSESKRWMGPSRYDWLGFISLMKRNVYKGEIDYVLSSNSSSHVRDGQVCKAKCSVCREDTNEDKKITENKTNQEVWKTVSGRFIALNSFLISCKCRKSPLGVSPTTHMSDGCCDLIIINDLCSRIGLLRHLYRCTKDFPVDKFDMPFIEVHRIRKFRFRPREEPSSPIGSSTRSQSYSKDQRNGVWNCDGEVVPYSAINYRVERKVLQVFSRGIE